MSKTPEEMAEEYVDRIYDAPHELAGDPEYCIKRRMFQCFIKGYYAAKEDYEKGIERAQSARGYYL